MTGIGGVIFGPPPKAGSRWTKVYRKIFRTIQRWRKKVFPGTHFVVLCFRRTGSNWLCGMLFNHPQILMHNEIFNENGVHTYYKKDVLLHNWDYEGRDINPEGFLDFMYTPSKFSKFRDDPSACKAVGYKSFPNHYLHKAVPLITVFNAFQRRILRNPNVHKIILFREDVLRTYVSSRRAFETGIYMARTYQDHKLTIDLVDMQRFIDRYYTCYDEYRTITQGHPRTLVKYEDLRDDPLSVMKRVWKLLGVDVNYEPQTLKECIPQSNAIAPLRDSIRNYNEVEFACRHDPILSKFLDLPLPKTLSDLGSFEHIPNVQTLHTDKQPEVIEREMTWALLVPVRALYDDDSSSCKERIQDMCNSIRCTSRKNGLPMLVFGVDDDDPVYTEHLLLEACEEFEVVFMKMYGLKGKICRIWKRLAATAYEKYNVDFTLLLGDDVEIKTTGWQESMEQRFLSIANNRNLPFGAACVAFVDKSFEGFPTFPCIHRWHYEAFGGKVLPSEFDNQGGDPFLFELYKRFGASGFNLDCVLENKIGGKDSARYVKERLRFEDNILTSAIQNIKRKLPESTQMIPCLDVVIPCYRCDLKALKTILSLRASRLAQVSFWVVLDNPQHPLSDQVRKLKRVDSNYQINILEQYDWKGNARNFGASAARNYGLAHSKADFCLLLDDDVFPSDYILDAYLGAMMRYPNASVLVGSTHLPPPHNLLTHAIVASDIPGAYTISERTREPPWGVTANLCVRARDSRIRFDLSYPKTGGGEDLDFCARARNHGPIRSVPGAKADHPWWHDGNLKAINHILGWAEGEVQCVGKAHMREHVFWTLPNGVEVALIMSIWTTLCHGVYNGLPKIMLSTMFILVCEVIFHASRIQRHRLRDPVKEGTFASTLIRIVAAMLIISQEFMRLFQALDHSLNWVLWRVDWHFGMMPHLVTTRKRNNALKCAFYVASVCFMNDLV